MKFGDEMWGVVAKRSTQAAQLAQMLSEWARGPVTVAWESLGVGRGDWSVRWADGPSVAAMRAHADTLARFVHPLTVSTLRWGRTYSARAWALALIAVAHDPDLTDWHDLIGQAEAWLYDAERPDEAVTAGDAAAADELVRRSQEQENDMARLLLIDRAAGVSPEHVTKHRDITKDGDEPASCAVCGTPVVRARAGRPARYCSAACRTRAWRTRTATRAVTQPDDVTKDGDEPASCAVCGTPVVRARAGRPARYCSAACRTRAWRIRSAE